MKLLLYCTKAKPYLLRIRKEDVDFMCNYKQWLIDNRETYKRCAFNGKIVAECDFEVEEIKRINTVGGWFCYENQDEILEKSRTDINRFFEYLKGKNGYAIHIKNLHIFDGINDLSCFHKKVEYLKCAKCKDRCKYYFSTNTMSGETNTGCTRYYRLPKAPQNMCYCYDASGNKYVLISIQPEWLCKILNGEKSIEVRKRIVKELKECIYDYQGVF